MGKYVKHFITVMLAMGLFFCQNLFAQSINNQQVDSLENLLKIGNEDQQISALTYLTDYYLNKDYHKAREYAELNLNLSIKTNNDDGKATALEHFGKLYYHHSVIDSALFYYNTALNLREKLGDKMKAADLRLYIGGALSAKYMFEEALENYRKALNYYEEQNKEEDVSVAFVNIGNLYYAMNDYEKYEEYTLKALTIQERLGNNRLIGRSLFNLALYYGRKGEYEEAFSRCERAVKSFRQINDLLTLCHGLNLSAEILFEINEKDERIKNYLDEAMLLANQIGSDNLKADVLKTLSEYYYKQGNYVMAKTEALNAIVLTDTTNYREIIAYYNILIHSDIMIGNKEQAKKHYEQYVRLRDLSTQQELIAKFSEMEVKYETEKKELKITILEEEKRLMTWLSFTGGAALLLALTVFFFLWRWMIQKKRVAEKQKELAEQQVKQLEQEKQLIATQAVLDGETQERTRLARDLHDGLGSMLSAVKRNLNDTKAEPERFNKALSMLDDSIHELRRVAHHLMPESLSRFGLKTAVSDFCSTLSSVEFSYYGEDIRPEPKLEVMIYSAVHELTNNALKHANASHILVQIIQDPDRIALTVQDDGCGFDPEKETKGMGLANIRNRVASFGGIINIASTAGVGTEINVEIHFEN